MTVLTAPPPDLVATREALRTLACYVIRRRARRDRAHRPATDRGWHRHAAVRGWDTHRGAWRSTGGRSGRRRADHHVARRRGARRHRPVGRSRRRPRPAAVRTGSTLGRRRGRVTVARRLVRLRRRAPRAAPRTVPRRGGVRGPAVAGALRPRRDRRRRGRRGERRVLPGDGWLAEPYVYVGPHDTTDLSDAYWNAPFGSVLTHGALRAAVDPDGACAGFIDDGLRLVASRPR